MFKTIPTSIRANNRAVPPWLTKRSGTPVSGVMANMAPIFMKDWADISITIPRDNSLLN